jgi:uncharacterized repeat protein (TIGR01451 family)
VFAGLAAAAYCHAQSLQCNAIADPTPTVRAEGLAELLGDFVLACFGGTPTAAGQPVPQVDVSLTLNTNITSRVTASGFSEALLIFDESHSYANPGAVLTPCDATNASQGVCSILGTGTGGATYSGGSGHPNVFQGQPNGPNVIVWKGVPIDPPGMSGTRYLRLTNIRANVNQLGVPGSGSTTQLVATIGFTPSTVAVSNSQLVLAYGTSGLAIPSSSPATLQQCLSANSSILADPSKPLDSGGQNGQQFIVSVGENFPSDWKEKNVAIHLANAATGQLTYPPDASQDVPGSNYFSESGFEAAGVTPAAAPPGYGPFLPAAGAFPSARGLNMVGTADQGTRLYFEFSTVPAGMELFVPVALTLTFQSDKTHVSGRAVLVSTDQNGNGPFSPTEGNASGLAPLSVTGGVATAVYEILYSDPDNLETLALPVAAAYVPNLASNQPPLGAIAVEVGFGPVGLLQSTVSVPRFVAPANTQPAFIVQTCASPALSIALTHSGAFLQGQAGAAYTATVSNGAAGGPTYGAVTVTETLPSALTLVSMSGNGWECSGNSCTRSDALTGGSSYPPITVTVSVAPNASSPQVNSVSVFNGNSPLASASDSTVITPNPPVLGIAKTHTGSFSQGQSGVAYTVVVSNLVAAGTTSGTVTVSETIPTGLTLVSMSGAGWTCSGTTCTRSDALAGGSTYPAITVTVNVAANSPTQVLNQVSVSGGGSAAAAASDPATVAQVQAPTVSLTTASGSGAVQTFTGTYSSQNGFMDLRWVQMLFAAAPDGGGTTFCFVHYDVQGNAFWVYGDGGFFVGPVTPPTSSNLLQNSLCALNTAASTATGSGSTLTLNANVVFKAGGSRNIYMRTETLEGVDTGWVLTGTWGLGAASLGTMVVNPSAGNSRQGAQQTFTMAYPDPSGFAGAAFGWVQFLVAAATNGGGQPFCFVHYDRAGNGLWMYSGDLGFFLGPVTPGVASITLTSTACSVNTAGATVTNAAGNLVVSVPITLNAPMVGAKNLYQRTLDVLNRDTGWQESGSWTIQ